MGAENENSEIVISRFEWNVLEDLFSETQIDVPSYCPSDGIDSACLRSTTE
jgi:hypothetical protein